MDAPNHSFQPSAPHSLLCEPSDSQEDSASDDGISSLIPTHLPRASKASLKRQQAIDRRQAKHLAAQLRQQARKVGTGSRLLTSVEQQRRRKQLLKAASEVSASTQSKPDKSVCRDSINSSIAGDVLLGLSLNASADSSTKVVIPGLGFIDAATGLTCLAPESRGCSGDEGM
jgi:hypothetical protein